MGEVYLSSSFSYTTLLVVGRAAEYMMRDWFHTTEYRYNGLNERLAGNCMFSIIGAVHASGWEQVQTSMDAVFLLTTHGHNQVAKTLLMED